MSLDDLFERLLTGWRRDARIRALPTLDGALRANRRLDDDVQVLIDDLADIDDIAAQTDGALLVSAGNRVLQVDAACAQSPRVRLEAAAAVGPITVAGNILYVGVAGVGVQRIEQGHVTATLSVADGTPLRCPTALAVLADGRLAIAEGSTANTQQDWARDLLERRAQGRIVLASADLSTAHVRASGLAWPAGVLPRGDALWISESWRHRLLRLNVEGAAAPQPLLADLPGYPGRLSAAPDGGAWLAVFALRTQLVEFVLRETAYREQMLASVDPRWWIAPSLRTSGHYLEPLQGGAIKKLGQVKPWAPPRSYGLACRLAADGTVTQSLHSRVGGRHHGITAVLQQDAQVLLASRGSDRLIALNLEPQA